MSPFFLDHGYDPETVQLTGPVMERLAPNNNPIAHGERIAKKLADAHGFAQVMLASAQESQERYANAHRQAALQYMEGDEFWLDLRNLSTT